jgi:hypothetical protein
VVTTEITTNLNWDCTLSIIAANQVRVILNLIYLEDSFAIVAAIISNFLQ